MTQRFLSTPFLSFKNHFVSLFGWFTIQNIQTTIQRPQKYGAEYKNIDFLQHHRHHYQHRHQATIHHELFFWGLLPFHEISLKMPKHTHQLPELLVQNKNK